MNKIITQVLLEIYIMIMIKYQNIDISLDNQGSTRCIFDKYDVKYRLVSLTINVINNNKILKILIFYLITKVLLEVYLINIMSNIDRYL